MLQPMQHDVARCVGRGVLYGGHGMGTPERSDDTRAITEWIRPLELRQYRYFIVLAEELHFAHAAGRLNVGQSNLSREIRALEHQVGLRLFYRTSRHTELTTAGERLLEHARRVLAAEEHARLAIGEFRRSSKERLRIGICERVACSRVAAALAEWRCTHPEVDLRIVSRSGRSLLTELEAGLLDAGITAIPVAEPGLVVERLWRDAWVAALPKGHALSSARTLDPADLTRDPLAILLPDPTGGPDQLLVEPVTSTVRSLFIAERPSSATALMTWVEAGCGIGLLSASQSADFAHPSVALRALRRGLAPTEVHLLRGDDAPSPALSGLIERLRARPA